jgi:NADPH-dependent 2,4-dienoyl-CoA reductase/sulfur reductase-like enzyme
MVGGGLKTKESLLSNLSSRHKNRDFKIDEIKKICPEKNMVATTTNNEYHYDVLILCTGIQPKKDSIIGLKEALDDESIPVGCNYFLDTAEKMNLIRLNFKGGKFLFTHPSTPIKCGGAP